MGPADAGGPRPDRLDPDCPRRPLPRPRAPRRKPRESRATRPSTRASGGRPLVAGDLLPLARIAVCRIPALGRERLRCRPQPGGVQSRLRARRRRADLRGVVGEPSGRSGGGHQRPALASHGQRRVARPRVPWPRGAAVGVRDRPDTLHPGTDQLHGTDQERPGSSIRSGSTSMPRPAGFRSSSSGGAAGLWPGW